ncbi:MAG: endonuclease III [Mogibacterium sp.]|nr:endonuclease III [Mogibacterium sp.]
MKKQWIPVEEVPVVLDLLKERYPEAGCALDYGTHFELLVSVILSAQTTDVSVNKVTPALFRQFPDAASLARAEQREVEDLIRSIGLYKNKAANIIRMAQTLEAEYGGTVPGVYEELIRLPGVGRKTANVVLAEGFGAQRIAVDTHVFRVSNRLGLADADDVLKTENMLMEVLPEDRWTESHHLLIFHGRNLCSARKPKCEDCPVRGYCRYFSENGA